MQYLKQSTAVNIKLGPFLDEIDGKTAEESLTITQPDIRLSKNGVDFIQKSAAQTLVHDENGWYTCNLSTTDTNTLGRLMVAVHESGALPVWRELMVLSANVFDSIVSGTDKLQTDAVEISNDTTAADNLELITENAKGADHKILISSDAQDLNSTLHVDAKAVSGSTLAADNLESLGANAKGTDNKILISTDAQDLSGSLKTDAGLGDANTELASVPTTVSGLRDMIKFLFEYFRNKKTVSTTTERLFKEDASTQLGSAAVSDDGTTFTKNEMN